jgi:hypothetical protein
MNSRGVVGSDQGDAVTTILPAQEKQISNEHPESEAEASVLEVFKPDLRLYLALGTLSVAGLAAALDGTSIGPALPV